MRPLKVQGCQRHIAKFLRVQSRDARPAEAQNHYPNRDRDVCLYSVQTLSRRWNPTPLHLLV